MRTRVGMAVLLASGACSGCGDDCMTEGCDALRTRAAAMETGIGGVIASKSDLVENGCAECGFADATLDVFESPGVVGSVAEANDVVRDAEPVETLDASERYAIPLDPGTYLLCARVYCINAVVSADATTTVNVKMRNGPTSFFVVSPDSEKLAEDFGLDVSGVRP